MRSLRLLLPSWSDRPCGMNTRTIQLIALLLCGGVCSLFATDNTPTPTPKKGAAQTSSHSNIKSPPKTVKGNEGNKEAGAAITTSRSNVKSPPEAKKGDTGNAEAGTSNNYNASRSNSAGVAVKEGDKGKDAEPGRKGRGVAAGRGGGAFSAVSATPTPTPSASPKSSEAPKQ